MKRIPGDKKDLGGRKQFKNILGRNITNIWIIVKENIELYGFVAKIRSCP